MILGTYCLGNLPGDAFWISSLMVTVKSERSLHSAIPTRTHATEQELWCLLQVPTCKCQRGHGQLELADS